MLNLLSQHNASMLQYFNTKHRKPLVFNEKCLTARKCNQHFSRTQCSTAPRKVVVLDQCLEKIEKREIDHCFEKFEKW
jgi:hypothetical protein